MGSGVLANPPGLKLALESAVPIAGIVSPVQRICIRNRAYVVAKS